MRALIFVLASLQEHGAASLIDMRTLHLADSGPTFELTKHPQLSIHPDVLFLLNEFSKVDQPKVRRGSRGAI